MEVLLQVNPPSRCGTVTQLLAAPCSISVKRAFLTKEDLMCRSVMKTVSGQPQLCHAKVIQTIHKKDEFVFFSKVKREETFGYFFYSLFV